jgi:hypothetical protein
MVKEKIGKFIGILREYSIRYLQECPNCFSLIQFPGQGHRCHGKDQTVIKLEEADELAEVIQRIVAVYELKD